MSGPKTFAKLSDSALDEHRLIHFHLDQLTRAIAEFDPSSADAETLATLGARIESLRERVEEHVHEEEDGGLYQGLLDAMPQAESDVMRLMGQHERILQALDAVRALLRRREGVDAAAIRAELESTMHLLREHEQAEESLIALALRRGGGA